MKASQMEAALKAVVTMDRQLELEAKKRDLMLELRSALLIRFAFPDMGVKAKVRVRFEGDRDHSTFYGDSPTDKTVMVVIEDGGREHRKPVFDVPPDLWPEGWVKAMRRRKPKTLEKIEQKWADLIEGARNAAGV